MNLRRSFLVFCVLLLALVGLLCWRFYTKRNSSAQILTRSSALVSNVLTQVASVTNSDRAITGKEDTPLTMPPMSEEDKVRLVAEGKNVPIAFWGKVIDQHGAPLAGVRVTARTRSWGLFPLLNPEASFARREASTSADGTFEISGSKGDVLTIETLHKEGYEAEPGASRSLGYNTSTNFTPNPEKPVEFRMWSLDQAKQSLISGHKFVTIVADGRSYTVDLVKGTIELGDQTNGDLRLWVKRDPEAAWGKRFDWSFELAAIDGGIAEEPDRYSSMFIAPLAGYTNSYQMALYSSNRNWSTAVGSKKFYIKTRAGQIYGRIDVEVHGLYLKDQQGRLRIKYTVNPSGSNILR